MIKISINMDISIFRFYWNIDEYFNKNIGWTKIIKKSLKYLEKLQKKIIK